MLTSFTNNSSPNGLCSVTDNPAPANADQIATWLQQLFIFESEVLELRVIDQDGRVTSGFFDSYHVDDLARLAVDQSQTPGVKGVYFTLNPLRSEVLSDPEMANQLRTPGTAQVPARLT